MADLGIYYAIRHKRTGQFMPTLRGKGYTFWNPDSTNPINDLGHNKDLGVPRLISSRRRAFRVIVQWAAMPNAGWKYRDGTDNRIGMTPDGRKKEDLEIVEVEVNARQSE